MMLLSVMPMVLATSVGTGVGVDVQTEDFPPQVWMCDSRIVFDDQTEPGRYRPGPEVIDPSSYTIQLTGKFGNVPETFVQVLPPLLE